MKNQAQAQLPTLSEADVQRAIARTRDIKGKRLEPNLSFGRLFPGAIDWVKANREALYCCEMLCMVSGSAEVESTLERGKMNTLFLGEFVLKSHDGQTYAGNECFLPARLEKPALAAIAAGHLPYMGAAAIVAVPIISKRFGATATYDVYDLRPSSGSPELHRLASEVPGIMPLREAAQVGYDPATGEVADAAE